LNDRSATGPPAPRETPDPPRSNGKLEEELLKILPSQLLEWKQVWPSVDRRRR